MRWCRRLVGLGLMLLTLAACGPLQALQGPPADPLAVLGETPLHEHPPRLRVQPLATGDETPYTPVMLPPDVRRAFVRGHTNTHRDLIGGHWWYVRIEDWAWPVEREEPLTPFSMPSHVPLAPHPPAQDHGANTTQGTLPALPSRGIPPFQSLFPPGTTVPGIPPPAVQPGAMVPTIRQKRSGPPPQEGTP